MSGSKISPSIYRRGKAPVALVPLVYLCLCYSSPTKAGVFPHQYSTYATYDTNNVNVRLVFGVDTPRTFTHPAPFGLGDTSPLPPLARSTPCVCAGGEKNTDVPPLLPYFPKYPHGAGQTVYQPP